MRIVIVDDEPLARGRLRTLIDELGDHEVVGEAANGAEALEMVSSCIPDLMLLDIRMPGINGLEAARHIALLDNPPAVIFTTAYGEHALEAFDAQAVDYLLKPIRPERLEQALARVQKLSGDQIGALQEAAGDESRRHIASRIGDRLELIDVAAIGCFVAEHKYVSLYHTGGEVLIEEPLKALESEFSERFVRVHRNSLVSKERIAGMEPDGEGGHRLLLRDVEFKPPVSRRHLAEIRKLLKAMG